MLRVFTCCLPGMHAYDTSGTCSWWPSCHMQTSNNKKEVQVYINLKRCKKRKYSKGSIGYMSSLVARELTACVVLGPRGFRFWVPVGWVFCFWVPVREMPRAFNPPVSLRAVTTNMIEVAGIGKSARSSIPRHTDIVNPIYLW